MSEPARYECPLCGVDFEGATCHGSCPFARGCSMVRCPACGFEFVTEGIVARWIRTIAAWKDRHDISTH